MTNKTSAKQVAYLSKHMTYQSPTSVPLGTMPAGSAILTINIYPITTFNGTGTVGMDIGNSEQDNNLVEAASTNLKVGVPLSFAPADSPSIGRFADEATIWASVIDQNDNSTAGDCLVVVAFAQDN